MAGGVWPSILSTHFLRTTDGVYARSVAVCKINAVKEVLHHSLISEAMFYRLV